MSEKLLRAVWGAGRGGGFSALAQVQAQVQAQALIGVLERAMKATGGPDLT